DRSCGQSERSHSDAHHDPTRDAAGPLAAPGVQLIGHGNKLLAEPLEVGWEQVDFGHRETPWRRCDRVFSARDTRARAFCSLVPIRMAALSYSSSSTTRSL